MRSVKIFGTFNILFMAYYRQTFPYLSYEISVWGNSNNNVKLVFTLQKRAMRLITGLNHWNLPNSCLRSCIDLLMFVHI